jgi:hypothetical protein
MQDQGREGGVSHLEFNAAEYAKKLGTDILSIRHGLRVLTTSRDCMVEWKNKSFHVTLESVPESPEAVATLCEKITNHMNSLVTHAILKTVETFETLRDVATADLELSDFKGELHHQSEEAKKRSEQLQAKLDEYFGQSIEESRDTAKEERLQRVLESMLPVCSEKNEAVIKSDIRLLATTYHSRMTPRSITRIFSGLQSPSFEASEWRNTPHWNKYNHYSFTTILRLAQLVFAELKK